MTSLLVSPLLSADLFQDLSQLQETWLTEGEFSSCMLFFFFLLYLFVFLCDEHSERNPETSEELNHFVVVDLLSKPPSLKSS